MENLFLAMKNETVAKESLTSYLTSVVGDAFIVFGVLAAALLFETYRRFVLLEGGIIERELVGLLLVRSAVMALSATLTYQFSRWGFFGLIGWMSSQILASKKYVRELSISDRMTGIYVSIASILITLPVRPVLQHTQWSQESHFFTSAFVKYDAAMTMLILAALVIPLVIVRLQKAEGNMARLYTALLVSSVGVAGWMNSGANYDARIYETRAAWITRDFSEQGEIAQKALADAEDAKSKAIAYYWLGVSANREGRHQEAISHQLKAIELDPAYGAPHSSISTAYRIVGEMEKSKSSAERCIELDPGYAWCYYALGTYYGTVGDTDQAIWALERAVALAPHEMELQNALDYEKSLAK